MTTILSDMLKNVSHFFEKSALTFRKERLYPCRRETTLTFKRGKTSAYHVAGFITS